MDEWYLSSYKIAKMFSHDRGHMEGIHSSPGRALQEYHSESNEAGRGTKPSCLQGPGFLHVHMSQRFPVSHGSPGISQ